MLRDARSTGWFAIVTCLALPACGKPPPTDSDARRDARRRDGFLGPGPEAMGDTGDGDLPAGDHGAPPVAGAADSCPGSATPLPPAPRYAACVGGTTLEPLTIIHFSDLHATYQPIDGGHSPFALIRAYADAARVTTGGRTLVLDAGDDYEKGSLAGELSGGDATRHLLPYLDPDVRILGNHDFAWGDAELALDLAGSPAPVLDANLSALGAGTAPTRPYVMLQVGCAHVGLFGLLTQPYDASDEQQGIPYLGEYPQDPDYVGEARAMVTTLRGMGADAVIALTHIGSYYDHTLVDQVAGLDLVVGGHDHEYFPAPYCGAMGGQSVDVGAYAQWIDRYDVHVDLAAHHMVFSPGDYRTLDVSTLPAADAGVDAEVGRMLSCFAPDWSKTVAYVAGSIDPANPVSFTSVFDRALTRRFPGASALVYEVWPSQAVLKFALEGGVTPQRILDAMFVERESPGSPGFTSFYPVPIQGSALLALCNATLSPTAPGPAHRVCPAPGSIVANKTYQLVIEKRDLFYPSFVFTGDTSFMPEAGSVPVGEGVEAFAILLDYARARGAACEYLDVDTPSPCP